MFGDYFHWHFLMRVVWPALIGSVFIGVPAAVLTYFVMRLLISRARAPQLRELAGQLRRQFSRGKRHESCIR